MTAINENGQVYWTFEELDLLTFRQEIRNKFDSTYQVTKIIYPLYEKSLKENGFDSEITKWLDKQDDLARKEFRKYAQILDDLDKIMKGWERL